MTGALAQTAPAADQRMIPASITLRGLTAVLIALFALDNVLLLGFLGWPPLLVAALAAILPFALACLVWKSVPGERRIGVPTIFICFAVAVNRRSTAIASDVGMNALIHVIPASRCSMHTRRSASARVCRTSAGS